MREPRKLSTQELRFAVDHALATHLVAERERARLAGCTDLDTLRATLQELGLPAADIDASLASLDEALARRDRRRRQIAIAAASLATALAIAAALVTWTVTRPPPVPTAFISVRYEGPGERPTQTWSRSNVLGGGAEKSLAELMRAHGLAIVETLPPEARQRLYPGEALEPALDEIRDQTGGTRGVLGSVRCEDQGSVMDTSMRSYRVSAEFQVVDLLAEPRAELAAAQGEQVGLGIHPRIGCGKGLERVMAKLLPDLEQQLGQP